MHATTAYVRIYVGGVRRGVYFIPSTSVSVNNSREEALSWQRGCVSYMTVGALGLPATMHAGGSEGDVQKRSLVSDLCKGVACVRLMGTKCLKNEIKTTRKTRWH